MAAVFLHVLPQRLHLRGRLCDHYSDEKQIVDKYHWLEETEMLDLTALAQSAPGAIAVNASILVGWRLAGLVGMLTAVIATVLPPLLVLSVISLFYAAFAANPYVNLVLAGMQAGVAAVIFDVVASLARIFSKPGIGSTFF